MDDGLELRKAAFECVDTLLDSCLDQVNPPSFIVVPYLKSGLDGGELIFFCPAYTFLFSPSVPFIFSYTCVGQTDNDVRFNFLVSNAFRFYLSN